MFKPPEGSTNYHLKSGSHGKSQTKENFFLFLPFDAKDSIDVNLIALPCQTRDFRGRIREVLDKMRKIRVFI